MGQLCRGLTSDQQYFLLHPHDQATARDSAVSVLAPLGRTVAQEESNSNYE